MPIGAVPARLLSRTGARWQTWRREGVPPAAAGAVAIVAAAASVAIAALVTGGQTPDGSAATVRTSGSPTGTASYATAPVRHVRRVHAALHDIAARCTPTPDVTARPGLEDDARLIVTFARRFPGSRFRIDDEWGTPLSLLLVTRHELADCLPGAAAIADQALPSDVRDALPSLDASRGN